MRYLSLAEVLELHRRVTDQSGGATVVRDLGVLEAAVAAPRQSFDGHDLYPTLPAKAAALGFALVLNHPFLDGNKRVGHAATETMLVLNGFQLETTVEGAENLFLALAAGEIAREKLLDWIEAVVRPL
jgi:death-on-curing protein